MIHVTFVRTHNMGDHAERLPEPIDVPPMIALEDLVALVRTARGYTRHIEAHDVIEIRVTGEQP